LTQPYLTMKTIKAMFLTCCDRYLNFTIPK